MNDDLIYKLINNLAINQAQELENEILHFLEKHPEYKPQDIIIEWSTDFRPLGIRTYDNKIKYEFPYAKEYYIDSVE